MNRHGVHAGGHSGWLMIACCVPMLLIAGALVATGVVSASFLVFAVVCTAMMALMMRGMHGLQRPAPDADAHAQHATQARR